MRKKTDEPTPDDPHNSSESEGTEEENIDEEDIAEENNEDIDEDPPKSANEEVGSTIMEMHSKINTYPNKIINNLGEGN